MEPTRLVILPGLDGTPLLLTRFVEQVPSGFVVTVLPLPDDPMADYESLTCVIASRLREAGPCHLVAESFSGPLGILLAHRYPDVVRQLTLVASFACSPAPCLAKWLPWTLMFRMPLPIAIAKRFFVGNDMEMATKLKDTIRQTSVSTLAERIRCVFGVDVRFELKSLTCPVLYLRPTKDRLVSSHSVEQIVEANRNVLVREIDGPHLILQTRPRDAWKAILDSVQERND